MADSPDLTQYIDLRIYDRDPQQVYEVAQQDLQTKMPEWEPREDNTEVMLMEAMALEVGESIFAINRLPNAIMVVLMNLYGIVKDPGTPPTTSVQITVVDSFGYTIPAGTRFVLSLEGGATPVVFSTIEPLLIPDGSTTGIVDVVGDRYTSQANGTGAGTVVELVESIAFIESASITATVTDGRDPETDLEWISRGTQRLRRLTSTLVTANHFTVAALERPEVVRATAIDLYDPAVGPDPGDNPGHVTVAVYGDGAPLSTEQKDAIEAAFEEASLANLDVHVVDPTINAQNVTVSVTINSGYLFADVEANIEAALEEYLSPEQWPWAGVLRRNSLISLITNVEGVDYVDTLTTPASDVTLTGVAPLVDLGTLVVTEA